MRPERNTVKVVPTWRAAAVRSRRVVRDTSRLNETPNRDSRSIARCDNQQTARPPCPAGIRLSDEVRGGSTTRHRAPPAATDDRGPIDLSAVRRAVIRAVADDLRAVVRLLDSDHAPVRGVALAGAARRRPGRCRGPRENNAGAITPTTRLIVLLLNVSQTRADPRRARPRRTAVSAFGMLISGAKITTPRIGLAIPQRSLSANAAWTIPILTATFTATSSTVSASG